MWVRVDDHVPEHPKFLKAGPVAAWLWVCGNCHCNKYLTDGFIDEAAVRGLGQIPGARKQAALLVSVGLWERCEGGYRVHDYHDHNPRADQIKAKREQDKLRKRLQAEGGDVPPPHVPIVVKPAIPLPETFQTESAAIPRGVALDSSDIPERSRAGARAPDPIPSPPGPSLPVPSATVTRAPTALAGTLPRDLRRAAWISRRGKHVPDFLHAEFIDALGGDRDEADKRLRQFYDETELGWPAGPIGDDPLKLWRAEFAAKFPKVAPAEGKKTGKHSQWLGLNKGAEINDI